MNDHDNSVQDDGAHARLDGAPRQRLSAAACGRPGDGRGGADLHSGWRDAVCRPGRSGGAGRELGVGTPGARQGGRHRRGGADRHGRPGRDTCRGRFRRPGPAGAADRGHPGDAAESRAQQPFLCARRVLCGAADGRFDLAAVGCVAGLAGGGVSYRHRGDRRYRGLSGRPAVRAVQVVAERFAQQDLGGSDRRVGRECGRRRPFLVRGPGSFRRTGWRLPGPSWLSWRRPAIWPSLP